MSDALAREVASLAATGVRLPRRCFLGGAIGGGVAWYGRLTTSVGANTPLHPLDIADRLNAPVLDLYGGRDDGIPASTVEEMQTRLSFGGAASKASPIHVYSEAPHGFHADCRPSYRKDSALDGGSRCLAWFGANGVG